MKIKVFSKNDDNKKLHYRRSIGHTCNVCDNLLMCIHYKTNETWNRIVILLNATKHYSVHPTNSRKTKSIFQMSSKETSK